MRTHVPWHWRVLATAIVMALALALAGWIYDAGRRFAGFDSSMTAQEIGTLREHVTQLEAEAARLRSGVNASESKLQIERTALQQLTEQVRALEGENVRLKEELAVFENLARGDDKAGGLTISRLHVEPDAVAGQYRYRMLVAQRGMQNGREFKGRLQIAVALRDGRDGNMMLIPGPGDPEAATKYAVSFRSFRRLEGVFRIPAEAVATSVEVRLVQEGGIKAAQRFAL